MATKREFDEYTLVLMGGEEIKIKYPVDIADEFFSDLRNAFALNTIWNVGNWCDVQAFYMDAILDEINMKLVVGTR